MLSNKFGFRQWLAYHRPLGSSQSYACKSPLRTFTQDNSREPSKADAWFFFDSVFPIRLGTWDLRYYISLWQEESLVSKIEEICREVNIEGVEFDKVEPKFKDGGIFAKFRYNAASFPRPESSSPANPSLDVPNRAFAAIEQALLKNIVDKGGHPSWLGLAHGNLWRVRGKPWNEDMRRYASHILRIAFDGPDVDEERIWEILRPYGRIRDMKSPIPVPSGVLRSMLVTFERTGSAIVARNCIHGVYVQPSAKDSETLTRLSTAFERPIKPHVVRDWLTSHPRIVVPIIVFLLGTITYTVFDPIRAFSVQAKTLDWFDYREFAVTKWVRRNTLDMLSGSAEPATSSDGEVGDIKIKSIWKDRLDAESTLKGYLAEYPSTATFVYGPAGSGKNQLLHSVLEKTGRRTVVIDCADIYAGTSDAAMVSALAKQTGYWPIFTFLSSLNNLIDLASVGLIGQKAGLSASLEDQVSQVLEAVGRGLQGVSSSSRKKAQSRIKDSEDEEREAILGAERRMRIRRGVWHDGRIDCVAGNIFSELGIGIERFGSNDEEALPEGCDEDSTALKQPETYEKIRKERELRNALEVGSLPVVLIKNFKSKAGKEEVCDALAGWAAGLVSGHIAHVIVLSEHRENAKHLAIAFPTKPLGIVAITDADPASSLSYITQKLAGEGMEHEISADEKLLIERFGGRASDLEAIIHKVLAGQSIAEAVEDIILRGVAELQKNAFGDDSEDAKRFLWTRQQAWAVLKLLAQKDEVQYQHILAEFPFKGDEVALRAMERAGLISITTLGGRPSTIRTGRPIDRYVLRRLLEDKVFQATQEIASNRLLISEAETAIRSAESELGTLNDIVAGNGTWTNKIYLRGKYLISKVYDASKKVERLEGENRRLKKVLESGDGSEVVTERRWWQW